MYKMKDVCQMTGLTEKAIRLYMEQKLVSPRVEDGIHRKAYFFDEKDVERLKDIAALRSAGFALADIKMMFDDPANISRLVEEKEALLAMEIEQKKSVQEVLQHLSIEEHSNVTKLADAIEPRTSYAKETKRSRMSRESKWSIAVLIFAAAMLFEAVYAGVYSVAPIIMSFGLMFGIFAIIMGSRYFLHGNSYKRLKNRGTGKIVAVVTNERIDEFLEVEEMSTLKEIGTFLLLGFLGEIWKRIRLDAYHPVIQYQTADGESHTATVKYGGFKKSWHIGDEVEIAWKDGKEKLVYICKDKVLRKKAWIHIVLGVIFFIMALALTTEEISDIMDHVNVLSSVVDVRKESFISDDLSEEEIMGFCYSHYQDFVRDWKYVVTSDSNLIQYPIKAVPLELYGETLWADNYPYFSTFIGMLQEKARIRYWGTEIAEMISDEESLSDLKELISDVYHFGDFQIENEIYRFSLNEKGIASLELEEVKVTIESGDLYVTITDGKFVNAKLEVSYHGDDYNLYEYVKEW